MSTSVPTPSDADMSQEPRAYTFVETLRANANAYRAKIRKNLVDTILKMITDASVVGNREIVISTRTLHTRSRFNIDGDVSEIVTDFSTLDDEVVEAVRDKGLTIVIGDGSIVVSYTDTQ